MFVNIYTNIKYFIIITFLLFSCKSIVKQFYQDSTARFNSYFIANENIKEVQKIIYDAYKWNYDEIIPIISPLDSNNITKYSDLTNEYQEKFKQLDYVASQLDKQSVGVHGLDIPQHKRVFQLYHGKTYTKKEITKIMLSTDIYKEIIELF